MCGFAGFVDYNLKTKKEILSEMTDSMSHRGPNDSGYEFYDQGSFQIGFGHRRLSILELSKLGHQPYIHNNLILVYNGEIYNFQEIKKELEDLGIKFVSNSDTEVLIKAFEKFGLRCVDKFIGMFAFAVYDFGTRKLYLVRDRAGVKPLYYYWKDDLLLFSSELKAFHKHPRFKKEIDLDSLALYFKYSYIPTPYSIFLNTYKLEPGFCLEIDIEKRNFEKIKYWDAYDFYNKPKLAIDYNDALGELEKIMESSFNYRMVSDVPVGVFLSGGYDSTAVASILQKNQTNRIKTFTIGFGEDKFNEAPHAKEISKILGTDHTEYYCDYKEAMDIIPMLPDIYDEPLGDNSVIPTTLVSQLAVKDVTVALSADGGDEVFGGYPKFLNSVRLTEKLPGIAKGILSSALRNMPISKLRFFRDKYNFETRVNKISEILRKSDPVYAMDVISQFNLENDIKKRFIDEIKFKKTSFDEGHCLNSSNDAIDRLLAIDYKTFLLDNNLTKVDRATMSVSLEGREPLLDHRILEFVSMLPSDYKIFKGVNKRILKDIVHKNISKEVMNKPKMGFLIPISNWFRNELRGLLEQNLSSDRIKSDGIFNNDEIQKLLSNYLEGKGENVQKIWHLLVFQLWYQRWF